MQMNTKLSQILRCFTLISIALAAASQSTFAQFGIDGPVRIFRGGIRMAMPAPAPAEAKAGEEGDDAAGDGAFLKPDAEAKQLLKRAEQFAENGRFDLACVLWQRVLDESGDSLTPIGDGIYVSLRREVEKRLAALPPLGLQTYRVTADGEAKALMGTNDPLLRETSLQTVVRRFFMSSLGDDAAYRIGCIALDRFDFVEAERMFAKALEDHPDPSVPRGEILLRLAIAAERVGDREIAEKCWKDLSGDVSGPSRTMIAEVRERLAGTTTNESTTRTFGRYAPQPALPQEASAKTLTTASAYEYPLAFNENPTNVQQAMMFGGGIVDGLPKRSEKQTAAREMLIDRWKSNKWVSAANIMAVDDRIFFKTPQELLCFSTKGETLRPLWQTAWLNEYEPDDLSSMLSMWRNNGMTIGNESAPRSTPEIFLFGDRVQHSLTTAGDRVYTIEGRLIPRFGPPDANPRANKQPNFNSTPRRTRVNWLACYDVRSGKARWRRGASDETPQKEGEGDMGFLAAPTACGEVLLAPVTDGGTIWLYGLSPSDGRTLWKTYLCDEPASGCKPWSTVGIAVEGREAYVCCGTGVVFAVEGSGGGIRWAARYPRTEKKGSRINNPYGNQITLKNWDGFTDDELAVYGRNLVVAASDSNELFSLDRRTGKVLWKTPRHKLNASIDYIVGMSGSDLYAAGIDTIHRYDIPSGLLKQERPLESSLGRAVLTEDSLYVPVKDSIVRLDRRSFAE